MIKWKMEKRKLSELMPYETDATGVEGRHNPRKRDPKGYADLKKSLDEIGMAQTPNISQENVILSGHQRVAALIDKFGPEHEIDVYVAKEKLTEAQMRDVVIWLNKAIAGNWDMEFIEENFENFGYGKYGFEEPNREDEGKKPDDAVPVVTESHVKPGDIYRLGRHRIMCGDSTNEEDVMKLMGTSRADMIFTDPPYNVNYEGEGKETSRTIQNDHMDEAKFRDFLSKIFKNYTKASKKDAALYCCYASRTHREFEDAINGGGWETKNQIIWVKLQASWGWGDYRWKHEPILYCHQKGVPINFYGDRKQYTEWTETKTDEQLLAMVKDQIEKDEKGDTTVWRLKRDSHYKHPTQKPVQLIVTALKNSSRPHNLVIDFFQGSGSTLIACEKTHRICYGMEIDPHFVAVIIKRWEEFTGNTAEKIDA